jgi:flagellar hook assembly protein FlgD
MITVPVDSIRKNPPPFVALATTDVFYPEIDQGDLQLAQNFPNPFPLKTSVRFTLAKTNPVNLSVIDMNGITITQLLNKTLAAGSYSVEWDGSDLPSGNYLIKLSNNDECMLKKCTITK